MERSSIYKYKPVRFFVWANVITWATWLTAAYFSYQSNSWAIGAATVLEPVGLFGPCAVALWFIFTSKSTALRHSFYERLLNVKLMKLWSVPVILLLMPASATVSIFISHFLFGEPVDQLVITSTPFTAGLIPIPLLMFGAALVEELGWKGYGVDSLRGERTFFTATIIFAALWAFWHVPTFFVNNYYQNMLFKTNPLFALNFFVSIFPAAVVGNWLWHTNRGSILTAVLFHASMNFQGILQMGQIAKCIETVVWIVIAMIVVGLNRKMFFGKFEARIGYYGAGN